MTIKSYAKLNLCLHVGPAREDGYHPIASVFQQISLHDLIDIQVSVSDNPSLSLSSDGIAMPVDETNILFKLFNSLKKRCKHNYNIHITKHIPLGSGMGGASSNAAVFIRALNEHEGFGYDNDQLCELGTKFGADIPFFIHGGTMAVHGIGDVLIPIEPLEDTYYVIIHPGIHSSTQAIYAEFDSQEHPTLDDAYNFESPYIDKNDLLAPALHLYPELANVYQRLQTVCNEDVYMTGSGSTFFSPVTKETAEPLLADIKAVFPDALCHVVRSE